MSLLQWEKVAGECLTDEVFLDFYDSSSTATACPQFFGFAEGVLPLEKAHRCGSFAQINCRLSNK